MEDKFWDEEECSETDVRSIAFTGMLLAGTTLMIIAGFILLF